VAKLLEDSGKPVFRTVQQKEIEVEVIVTRNPAFCAYGVGILPT